MTTYRQDVSTKAKREQFAAEIKEFAEKAGLTCEVEHLDNRLSVVTLRLGHYYATVDLDGTMPLDVYTADWNTEIDIREDRSTPLPIFPVNFGRYCLEPNDQHRRRDTEEHKATTVVESREALYAGLLGGFRRLRPIVAALPAPEAAAATAA